MSSSRRTCGGLRLPQKAARRDEESGEGPQLPFRFLSLPSELQNRVCFFLFKPSASPTRLSMECDCPVVAYSEENATMHSSLCSRNTRQLMDSPLVALAATCRLLRAEHLSTVLSNIQISMHDVRFLDKLYRTPNDFVDRTLVVAITHGIPLVEPLNLYYLLSSTAAQHSFNLRFVAQPRPGLLDSMEGFARQLNRLAANRTPRWVHDLQNCISGIIVGYGSVSELDKPIWILFKPQGALSCFTAGSLEDLGDETLELSSDDYESKTGLDKTWNASDQDGQFLFLLGTEGRVAFY